MELERSARLQGEPDRDVDASISTRACPAETHVDRWSGCRAALELWTVEHGAHAPAMTSAPWADAGWRSYKRTEVARAGRPGGLGRSSSDRRAWTISPPGEGFGRRHVIDQRAAAEAGGSRSETSRAKICKW